MLCLVYFNLARPCCQLLGESFFPAPFSLVKNEQLVNIKYVYISRISTSKLNRELNLVIVCSLCNKYEDHVSYNCFRICVSSKWYVLLSFYIFIFTRVSQRESVLQRICEPLM